MGRSYAEKVKSRARDGSRSRQGNRRSGGDKNEKFPVAPVLVVLIVISLVVAAVLVYFEDGDGGGSTMDGDDDNGPDGGGGPDHLYVGLESTSDGIIELSDHLGKVVVLDMFATWCSPCVTQIAELKELEERSFSDLSILSVDVDLRETLGQVRDFKNQHNADWTFATSNEDFNNYFPAESIPTLYILDKEGKKVDQHVGLIQADDLEQMIAPYL